MVPEPSQLPEQLYWVVTLQQPLLEQQAPVEGCGQGFGTQRPASVQVELQAACVVTVQAPPGAQQEPVTQDPAAKVILDRVAAKATQMKSIQADFSIVVEDKKENDVITTDRDNTILDIEQQKSRWNLSLKGIFI